VEREAEGDAEALVADAFQRCFQRLPSDREKAALVLFFQSQRQAFGTTPAEANTLLGAELKGATFDPATAAATVATARVLLNADAFITRE
jgi:hypothetical protein